MKKKGGARRYIVDQLQYGAALIDTENQRTAKSRFPIQHGNAACRQITLT